MDLLEAQRECFEHMHRYNIHFRCGSLAQGWPEAGPYTVTLLPRQLKEASQQLENTIILPAL